LNSTNEICAVSPLTRPSEITVQIGEAQIEIETMKDNLFKYGVLNQIEGLINKPPNLAGPSGTSCA